jgi:hypothetical protein
MNTAVVEKGDPAATAVVGHNRSLGRQESRVANDRLQSTADIAPATDRGFSEADIRRRPPQAGIKD